MKYLRVVKMGMKKDLVYNWSIVFNIASSILSIFILDYFWKAVFYNDYDQYIYMLSYSIISRILVIFYALQGPYSILDHIRTGNITTYLLKPWNYFLNLLSEDVGHIIVSCVTCMLPMIIITVLLFGSTIQIDYSANSIILFIISISLSFIILFLIYSIVHMISFWIIEASSLTFLLGVVISFFSGKFLPDWMMPDGIKWLMEKLPFIWIYQRPIELLLNPVVLSKDITYVFLTQLLWIAVLALICVVMWRKAMNKLIIQGG